MSDSHFDMYSSGGSKKFYLRHPVQAEFLRKKQVSFKLDLKDLKDVPFHRVEIHTGSRPKSNPNPYAMQNLDSQYFSLNTSEEKALSLSFDGEEVLRQKEGDIKDQFVMQIFLFGSENVTALSIPIVFDEKTYEKLAETGEAFFRNRHETSDQKFVVENEKITKLYTLKLPLNTSTVAPLSEVSFDTKEVIGIKFKSLGEVSIYAAKEENTKIAKSEEKFKVTADTSDARQLKFSFLGADLLLGAENIKKKGLPNQKRFIIEIPLKECADSKLHLAKILIPFDAI